MPLGHVVQLGGDLQLDPRLSGHELVRELAARLGGRYSYLHAPAILDSAATVREVLDLGAGACCEVHVAGAITKGRLGEELAPMAEMAATVPTTIRPAMMAVYRPRSGETPLAIAKAIARGRATMPTTTPASMISRMVGEASAPIAPSICPNTASIAEWSCQK